MPQRKQRLTFEHDPHARADRAKTDRPARRGSGQRYLLNGTESAVSLSDKLFVQLNQRLDQGADRIFAGSFAHMDLVVLQGKTPGLGQIFERLVREFRSHSVYRSKAYAFRSASRRAGHRTVFAIDLDVLGYIDRAIPKLMRLRAHNPTLAVLLLSPQFKVDDFSTEREAIADACVSLPANAATIMRGLRYAQNNALKRSEP